MRDGYWFRVTTLIPEKIFRLSTTYYHTRFL